MKKGISRFSLLAATLALLTGVGHAQVGKASGAIVEIDAFSGRPNPVFHVDLTDASKLSTAIRNLANDAKLNALTLESNNARLARAVHETRGIVITDPSGALMDADTSIVVKEDSIVTVRKQTQTVYANTHPELYKLLIKHAYQKGFLDRRAAHHLYGDN